MYDYVMPAFMANNLVVPWAPLSPTSTCGPSPCECRALGQPEGTAGGLGGYCPLQVEEPSLPQDSQPGELKLSQQTRGCPLTY